MTPCGTPAAARRHYRRGEKPCPPCAAAARTAQAVRNGSDPWRPGPDETPDYRPVRNGIPVRLYVYRGLGYDIYEQEETAC
jgi:hypothetical protein